MDRVIEVYTKPENLGIKRKKEKRYLQKSLHTLYHFKRNKRNDKEWFQLAKIRKKTKEEHK